MFPCHCAVTTPLVTYAHALNNFDINYTDDNPLDIPEITIRKELLMPYGTVVPNASFEFDVKFISVFPAPATPPAISISNLFATFNPTMTPTPHPDDTDYVYVHLEIPINISGINWPRAGVYRFRITEIAGSSSLGTNPINIIEYDPAIFYLYVYVGRPRGVITDPLEIIGYYARLRTPTEQCEDCEEDDDCETCTHDLLDKEPVLLPFINRFSRIPNLTTFEVNKIVTGYMGDPSLPFNFRVDMKLPAPALPLSETVYATITGYERDVNGQIINYPNRVTVSGPMAMTVDDAGELTHNFTLRHGDVIEFVNMPVGTDYEVTESFVAGYTQSGVATIGGVAQPRAYATGSNPLVIKGYVSEPVNETAATNFVIVTNAHDGTPPMGVRLASLPFGLMVALGAGALGITAAAVIVTSKAKLKK